MISFNVQESGPNAMVDPFEKATEEKRERVAKNELQRLRNIAKAKKVTLPGNNLFWEINTFNTRRLIKHVPD